jgi:hypothetical protein
MEEKISKGPILALLATSAAGLIIFSIAQFQEKKASQETAVNALQAEHAETGAVMRDIGKKAEQEELQQRQDKEAAYQRTPEALELKRLELEDRAATALPRSTPPR